MTSICLSMIVKNEAHVLARCLASVRPLISSWIIVDTGSTDDTIRVASELLRDIPGLVISRPWVDFATNRNEALELSKQQADYSLIIDADDELEMAPGATPLSLTHDAYQLDILMGESSFRRVQLLNNALPWRYEGVVHEIAVLPGRQPTLGFLPNVRYRVHLLEGARSRDPDKYLRDALLLEKVVKDNPRDARTLFHLAQSYLDYGDYERALTYGERHLAIANDPDQIYISLYRIGVCLSRQGAPIPELIEAFERAHATCPARAEALFYLAQMCRSRGRPELAAFYARTAAALPVPERPYMHLDRSVYEWRVLEELSLSYREIGDDDAARPVDERLAAAARVPDGVRDAALVRLGRPAQSVRFQSCAPIRERLSVQRQGLSGMGV